MTDPICPPGTSFAAAVESVRRGDADVEAAVASLLAQLTDAELLWLLDGDVTTGKGLRTWAKDNYNHTPVAAGQVDRVGIPGVRFTDGPRGVVMGNSTAFPVALARAATWDTDLERTVGHAIGAEARAQGANLYGGICINLAIAPGWGRSQESYGEDPVLLGAMGAAVSEGVRPWVMGTVKHFALNSMEEARFIADVAVDDDVLREVYLPHFRTVVEAGVDAVMSAYNSVNGEWAGQNRHLLTEILREDWDFRGLVMTDFIFGLRNPVASVGAGQDLEMPFRQQRAATLPAALADGRLARADVLRAATRLVRAQVQLALRAQPTPPADVVASPAHRELAREVARRGTVLLRNEPVDGAPVLPLHGPDLRRVAVLGRLADQVVLGDGGSSKVRPPTGVSVLQGLRERLGEAVSHPEGTDVPAAVAAARGADVAVVVVGLTGSDEGESMAAVTPDAFQMLGGLAGPRWVANGLSKMLDFSRRFGTLGGDRRDLHLHADDVALVRAVAAVNPRTVVVVTGGGTIMLDPWDSEVPAILLAWYPGMEGGRAIADLLLGDAAPSGRLPLTIPRHREDLPVVDWNASSVRYGRWWGQRKLDHDGTTAAYPLGFGLGYTTFALDDVAVGPVDGESFTATVAVTNTGTRPGRHVVQVYATAMEGRWPVRGLVGFVTVDVAAGASVQAAVTCSTRPLQRWIGDQFETPGGEVLIEASSFSGDPDSATTHLDPAGS